MDAGQPDPSAEALLAEHQRLVASFADAAGLHFEERLASASSPPLEVFLDGYLSARSRWRRLARTRNPDLRIRLRQEHERARLVVDLDYIYLPSSHQRKGLGRALVDELEGLWRAAGVAYIEAHAGTEAGERAFEAWGFSRLPSDGVLPRFRRTLG